MKLKKVVSLALAGVLAVSMLAGCAGKTGTSEEGTVVTTTPSIVEAVNDGQNVNNTVKVTFTDNTVLDAGLAKAAKLAANTYTISVDDLTKLTGIQSDLCTVTEKNQGTKLKGFLGAKANVETILKYDAVKDGDTFTYVTIDQVNAVNDDAAQKAIASEVNALVAKLDATTYEKGAVDESKYFDYSYTGNVSMASFESPYGVTAYYYVVVLNQTVAVKTV